MNLMDTRSGALRIVSKFKAPNRNKNAASTQKRNYAYAMPRDDT